MYLSFVVFSSSLSKHIADNNATLLIFELIGTVVGGRVGIVGTGAADGLLDIVGATDGTTDGKAGGAIVGEPIFAINTFGLVFSKNWFAGDTIFFAVVSLILFCCSYRFKFSKLFL